MMCGRTTHIPKVRRRHRAIARPSEEMECRGGDSNPYSLRNQILSLARLPISPPRQLHFNAARSLGASVIRATAEC